MNPISKPDHNRASITVYSIVALNIRSKLGHTINKIGAAQVLADLLQIDRKAPISWLRGDFKKHPISRENFLRFVRAYRTKPGLETPREITALAISLYGSDYRKAIELLDPADREEEPVQDAPIKLFGTSDIVMMINNLLESSPPEMVEIAFATMTMYQWFDSKCQHEKFLM